MNANDIINVKAMFRHVKSLIFKTLLNLFRYDNISPRYAHYQVSFNHFQGNSLTINMARFLKVLDFYFRRGLSQTETIFSIVYTLDILIVILQKNYAYRRKFKLDFDH